MRLGMRSQSGGALLAGRGPSHRQAPGMSLAAAAAAAAASPSSFLSSSLSSSPPASHHCVPLPSGSRRYSSAEPTPSAKEAVERTVVVNTLDMARKFEASGLSRAQAEAMTEHITTTVVLDRLRLSEKFVARADLEKVLVEQDARVGSLKAELVQKQEAHLATLHKDLERQQNFLEKMRSETRHEIDKLTASQRLDLNLEKG